MKISNKTIVIPPDMRKKNLISVLKSMMVGQEFDRGGHIIKRVPPTHSAVLKSKAILDRYEELRAAKNARSS